MNARQTVGLGLFSSLLLVLLMLLSGADAHTALAVSPDAPARAAMSQGSFGPFTVLPTNPITRAVATGHFNGDGRLDLASCNMQYSSPAELSVFLQGADGLLIYPSTDYAAAGCESMAVGDLNNDQRDDIAVLFESGHFYVYLQQSNGTFVPSEPYEGGLGKRTIAVADLSNDGREDVVVSGITGMAVFLQQANGTLGPAEPYMTPSNYSCNDVDTGDLNNDSRTDVAVMCGGTDVDFVVFLQTPSGTLSAGIVYDTPWSAISGIAVGDVTGDGRDDVALTLSNTAELALYIYAQTAGGTLVLDGAYSGYNNAAPVEIEDVNDDGRKDVVVAHSGWERLSVYLQRADGKLAPYVLFRITGDSHFRPQGLDLGDLNNDGFPDVAVASFEGPAVLYNLPYSEFLPLLLR